MTKAKFTHFKNAGEGRVFNFIDAMPGAGKTEYFVEKAAKHIRRTDTSSLILYVAPTVQLLIEAQRRVFAKIPEHLHKKAAIVVSSAPKDSGAGLNIKVEKPANAANRILKIVSDEEYSRMPQGSGQRLNFVAADVTRIKVLMITHEAFIRIKYVSSEDKNSTRLPLTHVMFDEARQCISKGESLGAWGGRSSVSDHELKCLESVLAFHQTSETTEDLNGKTTAFFNVSGMYTDKKVIAKKFRVDRYDQISKPMRGFLNELIETCAGGRNLMTVLLKVKNGKPDLTDSSFTPFTVLRPTQLFSGYGQVTLMSALFRDSQMWHILTNYNGGKHQMVSLLNEYDMRYDRSLRNIRDRHVKNREMLPKRLVCIPLTTSSSGALSTNQLNNGCIIPKELDARIAELAATSPERMQRSDLIDNVISGGLVFGDKQLTAEMHKFLAPPLWVMMREAYRSLRKAGCKNALLFMNTKSSHRVWAPANIAYIDLIRDALKYHTEDADEHDSQHLTAKEVVHSQKVDPRWFEFIKKVAHGRNKFFVIPRTTSVRGLNAYTDHTGFVHLAALNQENVMYRFFGHIMPDYDVDLDNVIDNVLQTLYRTNLRDPDSTSKIYMVVSNEFAIAKLAEKVFRGEDKTFQTLPGHIPRLTSMSYRGKGGHRDKKRQLEANVRGGRIGGKTNRKYSPELGKELNKAKAGLRQATNAKNPNPDVISKWRKIIARLSNEAQSKKNLDYVKRVIG